MSPETNIDPNAESDPEKLRAHLREVEARQQDEKLGAVGRLAGGIAHDLNNMLTPILAYGNIVLDELPPDSPLREYMKEVVHAGDRALALTKVLQTLRVKTAGLIPLSLNDAVMAQIDKMRADLGKDLKIEVALNPDAGTAQCEVGTVDKVVDEILKNAKQAVPSGGTVKVRTEIVEEKGEPSGAFVVLSIADDGPGMAPEVVARLGEPYFSTRPKGQGKGLGLAQTYAAVYRCGGHIRCLSETGAGTEFRIYFRRGED